MHSDIMEPLIDTFLIETNKLLDAFGALLLRNESAKAFTPADIDEMFRIVHTVKGSVGMMNLTGLMGLSHALEDLLSLLKRGEALPKERSTALFDLLFHTLDAMRAALSDFAEDGTERRSLSGLTEEIRAFQADGGETSLRVTLSPECAMENVRAYLIVSTLRGLCPGLASTPENLDSDPDASHKVRRDGLILRFPTQYEQTVRRALAGETDVAELSAADAPFDAPSPTPAENAAPTAAAEPEDGWETAGLGSYVSVHLSKVEELQNSVSELVLAQERLLRQMEDAEPVSDEAARLRRSGKALQGQVMQLRMVSVSGLFQRLHRAVREAGRKLGKEFAFIASGTDVEIDKSILDALSEALMHIVLNAAVHGIESTAERLDADKPLMGRIQVSARTVGTSVVITVRDDGRGISPEAAVAAAEKAGLTGCQTPKTAGELLELIMRTGVTTRAEADELSGRGVGLDVVRTCVNRLRGSITLQTEVGKGSAFSLRIPQSLAVVDCLCLGAGDAVFLLPMPDIYALARPSEADVTAYADGRQTCRFRGHPLPVMDLGTVYRVEGCAPTSAGDVLAILEGEDSAMAIRAEKLIGPLRTAIKPLPPLLERCGVRARGIAGCAVLPDSRLGLVLDAETLLNQSEGGICHGANAAGI